MKHITTLVTAIAAAAALAGCGTLNAAKDKIHEWTAPAAAASAPDVGSKGAGGGGAMRR